MTNQPLQYVPGTCNIGPSEIKRRATAGWIGLVATILVGGVLIYFPFPVLTRLSVFVPATLTAMAFLQASFHFCVAYGTKGLFNVANEAGKTETVSQQEFRKKDQQKARMVIIYSVLIGIVVAVIAVVI